MTPRLTHDQVVSIIGQLDDIHIAEIMACGATAAELIEARRWSEGYLRDLSDTLPIRGSVVAQVCQILRTEEPARYRQ